jgi:hypothetical protein
MINEVRKLIDIPTERFKNLIMTNELAPYSPQFEVIEWLGGSIDIFLEI